ncbi:hypothetical protein CcaCcLH18_12852 [Colletotrichum camelliae]|nr:hypothetical protein CcaCcLH18_12852 [Colletotrichum camelliae]
MSMGYQSRPSIALSVAKSDCEASESAGDHLEMLMSCAFGGFGAREEGLGALHQLDKVLRLEIGEQRPLPILKMLDVFMPALVGFDKFRTAPLNMLATSADSSVEVKQPLTDGWCAICSRCTLAAPTHPHLLQSGDGHNQTEALFMRLFLLWNTTPDLGNANLSAGHIGTGWCQYCWRHRLVPGGNVFAFKLLQIPWNIFMYPVTYHRACIEWRMRKYWDLAKAYSSLTVLTYKFNIVSFNEVIHRQFRPSSEVIYVLTGTFSGLSDLPKDKMTVE